MNSHVDESTRQRGRRDRLLELLLQADVAIPFATLLFGLTVACGGALALSAQWLDSNTGSRLIAVAAVVAVAGLLLLVMRLRRRLLEPLVELEEAVARVCQGEPGADLTLANVGILRELVRDIDSINEELTDLYEDMDNRVARQTARLAQKTASLKILYDVAANVNEARDLDDMLLRFMRILKEMVNGIAATVRIATGDGHMRLVGCIGVDDKACSAPHDMNVALCRCGASVSCGDVLCTRPQRHCEHELGRVMFDDSDVELVVVPLEHHGEVLGEYRLTLNRPGMSGREDILDLLKTIGSHLGVAVAKLRSDAEARRLSILEERSALAHELHDSLAQTLASLRFQVRLLEDSLRSQYLSTAVREDLTKIRSGMDQAHTELRELLNSFRAPIECRGLNPGLAELVRQFREETGVHVLFQDQCPSLELSEQEEVQMLRIAQEALANVRKHADAHTVRVLLTRRPAGELVMLIEDDGGGFEVSAATGRAGEHIGLSIMEERAARLGAELRIESEPGEGTRVELTYRRVPGRPSDRHQEAV